MYSGWESDTNFQHHAALWGISLTQLIKPEKELSAFITWWQKEGKVFIHIQWQQNLARSAQIGRAGSCGHLKSDINIFLSPIQRSHTVRGAE